MVFGCRDDGGAVDCWRSASFVKHRDLSVVALQKPFPGRHDPRLRIRCVCNNFGQSVVRRLLPVVGCGSGLSGVLGLGHDSSCSLPILSIPPRAGPGLAGVLPLLSHALDQAWRSRMGAELTVDCRAGRRSAPGPTAQVDGGYFDATRPKRPRLDHNGVR